LPVELLREAKTLGFSDEQLCRIMNDGTEDEIYELRKKHGITRVFKMVIPAAQSLKQRHLISIPLLKEAVRTKAKEAIRKK
jgi:Carbamoyl-phosphate synthetase large chain, oligomerisation domain.